METDVAIIGGGVNGLAAATVLAAHGLRVVVAEANPFPGGLAGGTEGAPSLFAYAVGLIPGEVEELLGLNLGGLLHSPDPSWVELGPDGEIVFRWWRSPQRLRAEAAEAGLHGLPQLLGLMERFWSCYKRLGLYYTVSPPSPSEAAAALDRCSPEAATVVEKTSAELLGTYLPRWAWDMLIYPSMLHANGFALAYYLQNMNQWSIPRSGVSSIARRLAEAAQRRGARILYQAPVRGLIIEGGQAAGIVLTDGARIRARAVLHAAPVYTLTRLEGSDRLGEWEIRQLEKMASKRVEVTRVDYLLRRPPNPPREEEWKGSPILVYWTGRGGGEYTYPPDLPGLVTGSGGIRDPLNPLPPGVEERDIILYQTRDRRIQELCCGNTTGHPDHVPMVDPYIMDSRPLPGWGGYKTSLPGLYHGSASSYPGGEINLVAGLNAAARIMLDMKMIEETRQLLERLRRTAATLNQEHPGHRAEAPP